MTDYPYNVEIDVAGVTFTGPGMETEQHANVLARNIRERENRENIQDVRVIEE